MKNIVVCIKQVPDTTEVKLDPVTGTLIRDGVPSIINPDDKAALEVALQIKEKTGSSSYSCFHGTCTGRRCFKRSISYGR